MADMNDNNISKHLHPQYSGVTSLWEQMRISQASEQAVKAAGTKFLPMTDGQLADIEKKEAKLGEARYAAYKLRAIYSNYVSDTAISMLGVMHAESPKEMRLPKSMEEMLKNSTPFGDSLEMLLRRVNENQLSVGRRGMLLETSDKGDVPKIMEYCAESILNWQTICQENGETILKFVLLDESGYDLQKGLIWEKVKRYRVLALDKAGKYYSLPIEKAQELKDLNLDEPPKEKAVYPKLKGNALKQVPFVVANATSTLLDIENPPLLALSNLCLAIYRGDADYRQHLYQQAQDTLFLAGFNPEEVKKIRVGAGASIVSSKTDATASFIGVNSKGLSEERSSLENLHQQAIQMGVALVEQSRGESGEALKTRLSVKTASMKTIALSGAQAIEKLLKIGAEWAGANKDEVVILPNLDFQTAAAAAKDLLDLMTARFQGLKLSERSIHGYMLKNDFTEMSYEEELQQIEDEKADLGEGDTGDE